MLKLANVATPLTALTGPPPASVPPPGFALRASVIGPVKLVTLLSEASSALTLRDADTDVPRGHRERRRGGRLADQLIELAGGKEDCQHRRRHSHRPPSGDRPAARSVDSPRRKHKV